MNGDLQSKVSVLKEVTNLIKTTVDLKLSSKILKRNLGKLSP